MSLDVSLKTAPSTTVKPEVTTKAENEANGKRAEAPQPVQALLNEVAATTTTPMKESSVIP